MHTRRRRFLYCLGASGVASIPGCLRLQEGESTTGGGRTQSAPSNTATEPAFGVSVVGRQFHWEFAYPEFDVRERQELVVPVETTVELTVRSEDVVHGFGVEELDIRVDALPDERSETTVTPETTGEYTAACFEYCGEGHSEMTAPVRVVSESEFETWRS